MNIGIFGGTFDPIHNGHLFVAESVYSVLNLDEVRLIPSSIPPHRETPEVSPQHRLAMVQLAIEGREGLVCDDREVNGLGPSFTMRTLESLDRQFPDAHLTLILGMDAFLGLETWYRWRDLAELASFAVVNRPGSGVPEPLPPWWQWLQEHQQDQQTVQLVELEPYDVSATELRQRLRNKQSVEGLLPEDVINYIQIQGLYA